MPGLIVSVLDFIPPSLHAGIKAGTEETDVQPYLQAAIDYMTLTGGTLLWPSGVYYVGDTLKVGATLMTDWPVILGRTATADYQEQYDELLNGTSRDNNLFLRPVSFQADGAVVIVADFTPEEPTPVIEYNLGHLRGQARMIGDFVVTVPSRVVNGQYITHHGLDDPVANDLIGFACPTPGLSRVEMLFGALQCGLLGWGTFWTDFRIRADNCVDGINLAFANGVSVFGELWYCGRGLVWEGHAAKASIHTQQVGADLRIFSCDVMEINASYMEDASLVTGPTEYSLDLGTGSGTITCLTVKGARLFSRRPGKRPLRLSGANAGIRFINCRSEFVGGAVDTADIDAVSSGSLEDCHAAFQDLFPLKRFPAMDGINGRRTFQSPTSDYAFLDEVVRLLPQHNFGSISAGGHVDWTYYFPVHIPLAFLFSIADLHLADGGNDLIVGSVVGISYTAVIIRASNYTTGSITHDGVTYRLVARLYGDPYA